MLAPEEHLTFNWEMTPLNASVLALPAEQRSEPYTRLVHAPALEHEFPGCQDDRNGSVTCQWGLGLFDDCRMPTVDRAVLRSCAQVRCWLFARLCVMYVTGAGGHRHVFKWSFPASSGVLRGN